MDMKWTFRTSRIGTMIFVSAGWGANWQCTACTASASRLGVASCSNSSNICERQFVQTGQGKSTESQFLLNLNTFKTFKSYNQTKHLSFSKSSWDGIFRRCHSLPLGYLCAAPCSCCHFAALGTSSKNFLVNQLRRETLDTVPLCKGLQPFAGNFNKGAAFCCGVSYAFHHFFIYQFIQVTSKFLLINSI